MLVDFFSEHICEKSDPIDFLIFIISKSETLSSYNNSFYNILKLHRISKSSLNGIQFIAMISDTHTMTISSNKTISFFKSCTKNTNRIMVHKFTEQETNKYLREFKIDEIIDDE